MTDTKKIEKIKLSILQTVETILRSDNISNDVTGKLNFIINLNTGGVTNKTMEVDFNVKAIINV